MILQNHLRYILKFVVKKQVSQTLLKSTWSYADTYSDIVISDFHTFSLGKKIMAFIVKGCT